ncbi:MAG: THUMP domain-containing protein [Gemmatimonadaceae bacterium]
MAVAATSRLFAIVAPGLEQILARELDGIGVKSGAITGGGVSFDGSLNQLRLVNLWSRVASRVLVRVDEFHANSFHELERRAKRVSWKRFVTAGQPIRFRVTCRKSRLYHSDAVAQRLSAAVNDQLGGAVPITIAGGSDDEDTDSGGTAQLFVVRLANDVCTISADSSGELLHRRGYRQAIAKAPLRETLAAAMLIGSEWDRESPLVDPMCGSGTIAIEAALMARQMAPGANRQFAFERWPSHDAAAWGRTIDRVRESALEKAEVPIVGSDRDDGAVVAAAANAERAGVGGDIDFSTRSVSDAMIPGTPGWIVTNPPYGLRLGDSALLKNLYSQIGKIVRERAAGYRVAMLSADNSLDAQLKLHLAEVLKVNNGGIPVRLVVGRVPEQDQ